MIAEQVSKDRSLSLATNLFDRWIRQRQKRPQLEVPDNPKRVAAVAADNFKHQVVEPRRNDLKELKELSKSISFADQAALLVMMELPVIEASSLLHRLGQQIAEDPDARYFSKINMAWNCGCGCGCGCGSMANLGYEEKLAVHHQVKPFSIDPFNELETPSDVRDDLLVRDFLQSYERLSTAVSEHVNSRYFQMGREFAKAAAGAIG